MAYVEDGIALKKEQIDGKKKTVFLIGDSIRMGYCEMVKERLADIANVTFPSENCRNSQYVLTSLRTWASLVDAQEVDAVLFNCGQWDVAHFEGDEYNLTDIRTYAHNIKRIILRIRGHFPNAKVYFATCSSMNPTGLVGRNPRTNAEVEAYNREACRVAMEEGVDICDIYGFTSALDASQFVDYAHLTKPAFASLGIFVASFLRERLK